MRKLILGIFVLQILALASSSIIEEIQQDRFFTPEDLTSPFTITLDFDTSFDINITSITGPSGQSAFCEAYPSEVAATVQWNGSIQAGSSYDNIRYYNGYYFALDTVSWRVLVASDMSNSSTYHFIEVDTSVNHQHSTEIPILLIDENHKYLYIFRTDMAVSYDLVKFNTAITQNTTIPKITSAKAVVQWPFKEYEDLKAAKFHPNGNFHFVVDNNTLEVWTTANNGEITFNSLAFDMDYFGTVAVDITDIAFKDNYAFLLDELNGVYVLNISDPTKYTHVNSGSMSQVFIADAKFIEVTGNTLNVISMNRRSTKLHEYTITITSGATPSITLTLNREVDLRDAVRDSHADSNFLYVLTGSQNVAAKHSIPAQYSNASSTAFKDGYSSYWPLSNIGSMIALPNGSSSKVVVIQGTYVTVYNFSETKATLRCRAGNFKTGTYVYNLMSMQRTCKAKTTSSTSDVCRVRQPVTITINSSAKQVSSNDDSNNTGLVVGIIVAILTVGAIVFAYWYFKLRNKTPTPTVRNDVFFRRLSRSPLNQDSSNLYKVTMDVERSGARPDDHHDDKLGAMRKKSDDFVLGPQRSDDAEESPKRAAIVRGKTFSEIEKPKKPIGAPKTNTLSNLEGIHRDYDAEI